MSDELADELAHLTVTLPAPVGVRIVFADGTKLPVEVVYRGDEDGRRLWVATVSVRLRSMVVGIEIDHLPPMTAVAVEASEV